MPKSAAAGGCIATARQHGTPTCCIHGSVAGPQHLRPELVRNVRQPRMLHQLIKPAAGVMLIFLLLFRKLRGWR